VLIADGNCTYEEKARNVERMGAQAIVIYEDPDSWVNDTRNSLQHNGGRFDGSGVSVAIPTLSIGSQDGYALVQTVKNASRNNDQVILQAQIEITTPEAQTISYSLYYGSILDLDYAFVANLYNY